MMNKTSIFIFTLLILVLKSNSQNDTFEKCILGKTLYLDSLINEQGVSSNFTASNIRIKFKGYKKKKSAENKIYRTGKVSLLANDTAKNLYSNIKSVKYFVGINERRISFDWVDDYKAFSFDNYKENFIAMFNSKDVQYVLKNNNFVLISHTDIDKSIIFYFHLSP